jgi:membrane protein implicated in regulation of membrane protease activity
MKFRIGFLLAAAATFAPGMFGLTIFAFTSGLRDLSVYLLATLGLFACYLALACWRESRRRRAERASRSEDNRLTEQGFRGGWERGLTASLGFDPK